MSISPIGSYGGISYNSIAIQPAGQTSNTALSKTAQSTLQKPSESSLEDFSLSARDEKTSRLSALDAFSNEKTKSDMDFLGSVGQFDLGDMDREISSLSKDAILKQYHVFAGEDSNILFSDENGTVLRK